MVPERIPKGPRGRAGRAKASPWGLNSGVPIKQPAKKKPRKYIPPKLVDVKLGLDPDINPKVVERESISSRSAARDIAKDPSLRGISAENDPRKITRRLIRELTEQVRAGALRAGTARLQFHFKAKEAGVPPEMINSALQEHFK